MSLNETLSMTIYASLSGASAFAAEIGWAVLSEAEKHPYRTAAYRVIKMMRTPTSEMVAEGNSKGLPTDAANVWDRMIFIALREAFD
jgi:hypothetical protein